MITLKLLLSAPLLLNVQGEGGGCLKFQNYATEIDFKFVSAPIEYNYTRTRKTLTNQARERTRSWVAQNKGHSWVSGSGDYKQWHTNGVTEGSMSVQSEAELIALPYDRFGAYYCPYVKRLKIRVNYASVIKIAREIKKGTCEFDAVMEHELKHHDANEIVSQTLADRMEADIPKMIDFMESKYILRSDVPQTFEIIKEGLRDALQVYSKEISTKMDEFNGHIDTPDEYRRVAQSCK